MLTLAMAENGKLAISKLEQERFDLVLSDYSIPFYTGGDIYLYLKKKKRSEPFVLITGENIGLLKEFDDIGLNEKMSILNKPVDYNDLINLVRLVIKDQDKNPTENSNNSIDQVDKFSNLEFSSTTKFIPIEIDKTLKLNKSPCSIFLKLSEKKYIRVINENDIEYLNVVNKYIQKKVKYMYIKEDDYPSFAQSLGHSLSSALTLKEKISNKSTLSIVGDSYVSVQDQLKFFGFKPKLISQIESTIDKVTDLYSKDLKCKKLLQSLKSSKHKYLNNHLVMVAYVSNIILKYSDWSSKQAEEKLTLAAMFHDIALKNPKFEDYEKDSYIPSPNQMVKLGKSPELDKYFLSHPQRSVDILAKIPTIPDITSLIMEHHELPDGSGFPHGMHASRISPLSSILILAHAFTDQIIDKDYSATLKKEVLSVLNYHYTGGHFDKLYLILKDHLE